MRITRREILVTALASGCLMVDYGHPAAAAAASEDPYAGVDPELIPRLRQIGAGDLSAETLWRWRNAPPTVPPETLPPPAPQLERKIIPGSRGNPPVTIFVVDPTPGTRGRPAYVYVHGGGYVMFSADRNPRLLQEIAIENDCVVVAVDYRLAPEARFPAALEDIYAALCWLRSNASALGVDASRIAVGGESAGAGHVASLSIAARDRGGPNIAFQLLIYPMLDDRTGSSRPAAPNAGRFIWTPASNRFGWSSLLGMPAGSDTVPAHCVPARATDLGGLPPTYIGAGAIDLFAREDIEFAGRLMDAAVPTELLIAPGAYHGFDLAVPDASVSRRFTTSWKAALKRGLAK